MGGGGGGVKFIKNKVSHAAVFRLSGSPPPRLVALLFARAGSGFLYNTKKDSTISLSILL